MHRVATAHPMNLPSVTLACVDTREPTLALAALRRCTDVLGFADVVLFTVAARLAGPPASAIPGLRVVDVRIDSAPAYSDFMLRGLRPHLRTEHLLVVQWDGWVVDPAAWDDAFLGYDYLGAPWPDAPAGRTVGNGGFSLRSRRLLRALADPALEISHPEDLCICHRNRELLEGRHGMRFAPAEVAARFAFERTVPAGPTLGFHGLHNLHRVLPPKELTSFLADLPDHLARGRDARDLCKALLRSGDLERARLLLEKARRTGPLDLRATRMWARYAAGSVLRRLAGR